MKPAAIDSIDRLRLEMVKARRDEMIADLIKNKKFTPDGARKCVDVFLENMEYILETTGSLPNPAP